VRVPEHLPGRSPVRTSGAFASLAGGVGGRGGRTSYTTAPVAATSLRSAQNILPPGPRAKTPHFAVYVSTVLAFCS